jgi:hypothetical protein
MADMILAAEENCEDANLPCGFVDVEPIDSAVDDEIAQPREHVVARRRAMRKRRQSIGGFSDVADSLRGVAERVFPAFAEPGIAFEQMSEDQFEIALALGRNLVSSRMGSPHSGQKPVEAIIHLRGRDEFSRTASRQQCGERFNEGMLFVGRECRGFAGHSFPSLKSVAPTARAPRRERS